MLRKLYLSPLGIIISVAMNWLAIFKMPLMVYGYFNRPTRSFRKHTRIGSTAILSNKKYIDLANNIWIGHYCLLDGIGGIQIGEGVHIASHSCIYTHSSQDSIRILGEKYIEVPAAMRTGYILNPVNIGAYTFIGAGCIVLPGTKIGKGCVVGAGSLVKGVFPDYSIIVGNPGKIAGDTRQTDEALLAGKEFPDTYYDKARMVNPG